MTSRKSKNATKNKEYDILIYKKGFISTSIIDGNTVEEYFQFKEIVAIIHHTDVGVELVHNGSKRRVFYNDGPGESLDLFTYITNEMKLWMNLSN